MKLGEKLKALRKSFGKTQTDIAQYLGTAQSVYARYENNKLELPYSFLIKLADYYRVSLDDLFDRDPKNYL